MPGNKIIFNILKQDPIAGTWTPCGSTPEAIINDISITTKANMDIQPFTAKPFITPLGVTSRECLLSGYFSGYYITPYKPMDLSSEESTFTVIQPDDIKGYGAYGISLQPIGYSILPELAGSRWKITEIKWDKQASEMGRFRFSLTLSYVWAAGEGGLFATGIGTGLINKPVQLKANDSIIMIDPTIHMTLKDVNTLKFKLMERKFEVYDTVKVTQGTEIPFWGYVIEIQNNQDGSILYTCVENCKCLYDIQVKGTQPGLFRPRVKIDCRKNDNTYRTLQEYVNILLTKFYKGHSKVNYDAGPGIDKTNKFGSLSTFPNSIINIPSQVISGLTVGKALDSILREQCGLYWWSNNKNQYVEYGYTRDAITIVKSKEFIQKTEKLVSDANNAASKPDYVIVWNKSNEIKSFYGNLLNEDGTYNEKATCVQYTLSTDLLDRSLDAIAKQIYTDMTVNNDTFKVTFPAGTVRFKDGDYFRGLGDQTVKYKMEPRTGEDFDPYDTPGNSVWQIKEVVITNTYTQVIVGTSYISIFDIFGNNLKQITDGIGTPTDTNSWDSSTVVTGVQNTDNQLVT